MTMNDKYVILLTGSINPKGMIYTAITDTEIRKQQYIKAIRFYLQHTSVPIVFCENTLSSIEKEEIGISVDDSRIEILTFDGNNFDKSLGKGYGECEIISYAISHSRMMGEADYIIKITGRIIINNIGSFINEHRQLPSGAIQTLTPTKNKFIESRLIISSPAFFSKYFIPKKNLLNDSKQYYFEHLLYDTILNQDEYLFVPFMVFPDYEGQSGTLGGKIRTCSNWEELHYKKDTCLFISKSHGEFPMKKIPTKIRISSRLKLLKIYFQLFYYKIKP